jgi:hypothetical protein
MKLRTDLLEHLSAADILKEAAANQHRYKAEGFQRRIFLPELEILAGDFLDLRRQTFEAVPKFRPRGRFHGNGVALPAR